jgi:hypothetical protein
MKLSDSGKYLIDELQETLVGKAADWPNGVPSGSEMPTHKRTKSKIPSGHAMISPSNQTEVNEKRHVEGQAMKLSDSGKYLIDELQETLVGKAADWPNGVPSVNETICSIRGYFQMTIWFWL